MTTARTGQAFLKASWDTMSPQPHVEEVPLRKFSVRPTLTLKGRTFKGLRGWSGKPLHPPLTDFPIVAYILVAAFDVMSAVGGKDHAWAREMWHAATFVLICGAAVSVLAALTGLWDAWKSSEAGTQARRTINTHATIMVIGDRARRGRHRLAAQRLPHAPRQPGRASPCCQWSSPLLVTVGATFGGSLVFEYGFNVETAGDAPGVAQVGDRCVPRSPRVSRRARILV